jgi:hypothetical protein
MTATATKATAPDSQRLQKISRTLLELVDELEEIRFSLPEKEGPSLLTIDDRAASWIWNGFVENVAYDAAQIIEQAIEIDKRLSGCGPATKILEVVDGLAATARRYEDA